jgi:nucleoid-associated protein YgaU
VPAGQGGSRGEGGTGLGSDPATAGQPSSLTPSTAATDPNSKVRAPAMPGPSDPVTPAGVPPGTDPASTGAARPLPPLGAPATGTSPPIAVPAPPGLARAPAPATGTAQVDSYDEETYLCKASDTFEDISARFYHSLKYSQALLLFNRAHPRRAAALWNDPPQLQEGQPVYIPPLRILERQFGHSIPDLKPLPAATVPGRASAAGTSLSSSRPGPSYAVRKTEMISAIAKETLGNWERWTEIYELNAKNFDPSHPLNPGVVLQLPADARIPPENRP